MKRLLPLALVLLFSCSKQESSTTDNSHQAAVPQAATPQAVEVKLTPGEVEDAAWQMIVKFNDYHRQGDADRTALIEELSVNGNHILYKLILHNGDDGGWRSDQDEYTDENPPGQEEYPEEEEEVELTEEEQIAMEEAEAQRAYDEAYAQRGLPPVEPNWYYTNQVDTFTYDGEFVAYLDGGSPEAAIKRVKIVFTGKMVNRNSPVNPEGVREPLPDNEIERETTSDGLTDMYVELGAPIIPDRNMLYLRAKVANLTDQELAGMSKEELGYLRNEIFARHGHTFKTDKMLQYFDKRRWHHAIVPDAAPLLNKFEKRNVEFIKKKEG